MIQSDLKLLRMYKAFKFKRNMTCIIYERSSLYFRHRFQVFRLRLEAVNSICVPAGNVMNSRRIIV